MAWSMTSLRRPCRAGAGNAWLPHQSSFRYKVRAADVQQIGCRAGKPRSASCIKTDAAADPNVKIIGTFPEDAHPPIIYPIALTSGASHPDAGALLDYVTSAKAKPLFEAQGFTVLGAGRS